MKITKKIRNTETLTFPERGLLDYLLETCQTDGLFQRHYADIAEHGGSTPSTVRRWMDALIAKGAVSVVTPTRRGPDGFRIPPILRPHAQSWNPQQTVALVPSPNSRTPVALVQPIENPVVKPTPNQPEMTSRGVGENLGKPTPNGEQNHISVSECKSDLVNKTECKGVISTEDVLALAPASQTAPARPLSDEEKLVQEFRQGRRARVLGGGL
jgi:hypothetical protein